MSEDADKLVREARRHAALGSDNLLPYNHLLVGACMRQLLQCYTASEAAARGHARMQVSTIKFQFETLCTIHKGYRLRQALMIYNRSRMDSIKDLIWQRRPISEDLLSPLEKDFAKEYRNLIRAFSNEHEEAGLEEDIESVPEELFVDCRVIKDAADPIQTEYGSIQLRSGQQLYLRLTDAEPLAVAGYVTLVHK